MRRPCGNCPWRTDAPREHWDPEHFRSIARTCRGDGMHVMLCHKAKGERPAPDAPVCQGWVRVLGFDAIGVRIAAMTGRVAEAEVFDREGPELFKSFDDMLDANRIVRRR